MSANRNLTLIINPISGTVSKRGADRYIERKLAEAGYAVRTVFTERAGHARELAAEAAARGDYGVLACGGDGTINEIASSLVGTDTAIGIVPMGSGNGLARHIGIPVDLHRSLKVIKEDNIVACDYGTANGVPFFCTCPSRPRLRTSSPICIMLRRRIMAWPNTKATSRASANDTPARKVMYPIRLRPGKSKSLNCCNNQ